MSINSSGTVSLAGATLGQSIAVELGLGNVSQISLNDGSLRTLAGVPSGAIAMSNFYGKSNNVAFNGFNAFAFAGNNTVACVMYCSACNVLGTYVSLGYIGGGSYYISTSNPDVWVGAPTSWASVSFQAVAVTSHPITGLFVAVGSMFISSSRAGTSYSSDGVNWSAPLVSIDNAPQLNTVTYNPVLGKFIAAGSSGNAPYYSIASTSVDGMTWSPNAIVSTTSGMAAGLVTTSSGLTVGVGVDVTAVGAFTTTTDGATWSAWARFNGSAQSMNGNGMRVAINSSGLIIAIGAISTRISYVTRSTNGTTWTTPAAMFASATWAITSLQVNNFGEFVGIFVSSSQTSWSKSTDGITWSTPVVIAVGPVRNSRLANGQLVRNAAGKLTLIGSDGFSQPCYAGSN